MSRGQIVAMKHMSVTGRLRKHEASSMGRLKPCPSSREFFRSLFSLQRVKPGPYTGEIDDLRGQFHRLAGWLRAPGERI